MIPEYRKSNDWFSFHNENPKDKVTAQDCVVRALGYANDGWDNVFKDLSKIAYEVKNTSNSDEVMEKYLALKGWEKQKQPRKSNNKKYTVKEFAKKHKDEVVIVRITQHITVIDCGTIVDTWDCSRGIVGNYWIRGEMI